MFFSINIIVHLQYINNIIRILPVSILPLSILPIKSILAVKSILPVQSILPVSILHMYLSERLIFVASFRRSPVAPVLLCRSEPARSTMFSLPTLMWASLSGPISEVSTVMVKILYWHIIIVPRLSVSVFQ